MKYICFLLIVMSAPVFAQESWDDFSGEEKAFFYNISRRTEIIEPELFHLFEFTDSIPYINDTLPDHKYVEREIVKNPEKLLLHTDQLARKPNGLISDLATHFALWELDAALKFRNSETEIHQELKPILADFEQYVLEKMPLTALRTLGSGEFVVRKPVRGYYEPALQLADKMAALKNSGFSLSDQMLIVNAIAHAAEKYVENRSAEIVAILGGESHEYRNYLSAAGDGSGYSSLEGGILTPYNRILPDDKGLFGFEVVEKINKETERKFLKVQDVRDYDFKTSADRATVIHFDVYGYHPERQTTIAIQKGGASYILYGKNEHRLLSPDSTYGEGTTYWRLMWELEYIHIAELNEALYGKKGYEYWINEYEERIQATLLRIKQTEYRLNQLREKPEGKIKIKKKKFKKKDLERSDQSGTGHPTSKLSKTDKKKNIEQNRLNHLNTLLENEKSMLNKLKIEMEVAYFRLQAYKTLLDRMQKNLGYIFMQYEQKNDIYTFQDGSTFNYATQDFTFLPNARAESFRIYHIAFGKTVFASQVEESFVHMNLTSVDRENKYVYQKIVAESESTVAMSKSDSIQIMEIFQYILDKDMDVQMKMYSGGILAKDSEGYFRDSLLTAEPYDPENEIHKEVWKYRADWDEKINLSVKVWQDKMLPYNFEPYEKGYAKLKKKYPALTEIDYTAAVKSRLLAYRWVEQMKKWSVEWFEEESDQKKILKKLNRIKMKEVGYLDGEYWEKVPLILPES
ncbi:MAG: hypothetical protein WDZ35_00050 [Crocinitomicaceae bacterium]